MQSRLPIPGALRAATLACLVFLAAGLTIDALGPSLPVLAARMAIDVAALGALFTTFSAGIIAAQFTLGVATARLGERNTLIASMLLMGAGGIATAQSTAFVIVLGASFLCGAGFGGILAAGNTLVANLFPARRTAALNGVNVFFGIGAIAGPALAGAANAEFGAPQLVMIAGGGLLCVLSLAVAVLIRADRAHGQQAVAHGRLTDHSWLFAALLFVYVGVEVGFGAWLTLFVSASTAMDLATAPLIVSAFWFALTGGRILAAAMGNRLQLFQLLLVCLGAMLLGALALLASIGNIASTVAAVLLFGLGCGPVFPTVMAGVTATARGSAATGRVLAIGNGGGLIVPALIGVLLTQHGPAAVGLLLAAGTALMIGLALLIARPAPPAEAAAANCEA